MRASLKEQGVRCRRYLLPAAFLRHHLGTFRQTRDRHDPIIRAFEIEDANSLGVAADLAEFIHLAPKHFALSSHEHDLIAISNLKTPTCESEMAMRSCSWLLKAK